MDEIIIRENSLSEQEWDEFVQNSKNGTIFHEMKFLKYHGDKFDTRYFAIYHDNSLKAVCSGVFEDGVFKSHKGSTYGGIVFNRRTDFTLSEKIIDGFHEFLKQEGATSMQFRIAPTQLIEVETDEYDFHILQKGGKMLDPELSTYSILPSNNSTEDILTSFSSRAKRAYKKAKKAGVIFKWDDRDYEEYYEILKENLMERYGKSPTHTLEEMYDLKNRYPDRIFLASGYHEGKMIAGTFIMVLNSTTAHYFYISTKQDKYPLSALNYVFPNSMFELSKKGIFKVNFGISSGKLGKTPNMGLFKFKEGFQNRNILRKSYVIDLN